MIALYVQPPDLSKVPQPELFGQSRLVAFISALAATHVPLEAREAGKTPKITKVCQLLVY